jgi:hypothetical protein
MVRDAIGRLLPRRASLVEELADCLTISQARWSGDPQTVVHIDRLPPSLAPARGTVENDETTRIGRPAGGC